MEDHHNKHGQCRNLCLTGNCVLFDPKGYGGIFQHVNTESAGKWKINLIVGTRNGGRAAKVRISEYILTCRRGHRPQSLSGKL